MTAPPAPMEDASLLGRLLDVIEQEIVPKTRAGVEAGNKIFGAAILRKADLSVVVAETNNETENPLWHGEMHALKRLYEGDASARPAPRDCLFLSTHEPCSLCLSAITWGGYDTIAFLFTHEDSRDSFAIPHDIRILEEVFATGIRGAGAPLYHRRNAFWTAHPIRDLVAALPEPDRAALGSRIATIARRYDDLSATYQARKAGSGIPLA